ncbi:hypothetical protein PFISCL1PPCAC_9641, partial [Pristionchus fissidentatus]
QTREQVWNDFSQMHKRRVVWHTRMIESGNKHGFNSQQFYAMKESRDRVNEEIWEFALWWNRHLNNNVVDLHNLLGYQALKMVMDRIKLFEVVAPPNSW